MTVSYISFECCDTFDYALTIGKYYLNLGIKKGYLSTIDDNNNLIKIPINKFLIPQ